MKKYILKGGGKIKATTPTGIIEQIRATSLHPCDTLEKYMVEVSRSCHQDNGSNIRTESHRKFVNDLIANGFIEEVNNG
ncbi:MAG: hypothetical protein WC121_10660 [Candidatus Kapaibacterium sp.]